MTEHPEDANWNAAEWHGGMLVERRREDRQLQDVYDHPALSPDRAEGTLRVDHTTTVNPR